MNTKEQLIKSIKEWMKNDNEIRLLNQEIKERKRQNQIISLLLIDTMKKNDLNRFNINDGKIVYSKKNIKKPMNQKLLLETITKYYNNDEVVAKELMDYILSNRTQVVKEEIVLRRLPTTAADAADAAEI
jgi:hypothetical protein